MAAVIEQLHYTWSPRGMEGINRFQICAMSAGLRSGSVRSVLPAVRKICRYDRPRRDRDANPVSFGWFDHRDHRIAFCRVRLPPARGKVGNFAAHVLVGPPAALRECDVASTFGASFWWRGDHAEDGDGPTYGPRDFELPMIDFDEALRTRLAIEDVESTPALALSHALLQLPADGRLAVTGDNDAFGRALRVIGHQLPEAFDGLSLSTYEGAPTFPFRVIGTKTPKPRQLDCSLAMPADLGDPSRATLDALIMPGLRNSRFRAAARTVDTKGAGERREAVWSRARTIVGLATGENPSTALSAALLSEPEVVTFLAGEEGGRACLAAAAQVRPRAITTAMRAATGLIGETNQTALYATIVDHYTTTRQLRGCGVVVTAMANSAARGALLDMALGIAVADEHAAAALETDDATALTVHAVRQNKAAESILPLLHGAATHLVRCATERSIPDEYLAIMFRHLLSGTGDPDTLVEALRVRPALLEGIELNETEKDNCLEMLAKLPRQESQATVLRVLLPLLSDAQRAPRIAAAVRSLPPTVVAPYIVTTFGSRPEPPEALSALCDDLAAAVLSSALGNDSMAVRDAQALALKVLACSRSRDSTLGSQLVRGLLAASGEPPVTIARQAADLRHRGLREAVTAMALDLAVGELRRVEDVAIIWRQLRQSHVGEGEQTLLRELLHHGRRQRPGRTSGMVIVWIVRELLPTQSSHSLTSIAGRLRDPQAERLARDIVTQLPEWCLEGLDSSMESADRRAQAVWRGLIGARRKATRSWRPPL